MSRMIGSINESFSFINGQKCKAVIDTGSVVTTICEQSYISMNPRPELTEVSNFDLNFTGASGSSIPYIGYIEAQLSMSDIDYDALTVPILTVSKTRFSGQVPIIVGTNIIAAFKDHVNGTASVHSAWKNAFNVLSCPQSKIVTSTNKKPVIIKSNETVTLTGLVRITATCENAVTENRPDNEFNVCPRIVSLKQNMKTARVPVRICNISARHITIKPKTPLCNLHEVKVIKNVDPFEGSFSQKASSSGLCFEDIDVSLPEENLTPLQKQEAGGFLDKWKHIFSTGPSDLGFTDLVEHEINLSDNTPFKDPYRRFPPAMFEEVGQHIKEMLDACPIRQSQSPFSSNIVLVRKKDNPLRFCIDFRKLNNRTVKKCLLLTQN